MRVRLVSLAASLLSTVLADSIHADTAHLPALAPEAAAQDLAAPAGFQVRLFAAEPDVVQPVAMNFDDRGRLWVVECLTYADLRTNFDLTLHDRIVILEDADGDGRFDQRKVFWDRGQQVTSVAVGFGGAWVLAAPRMLFIPDCDGDDVPDGEPMVLLDGWDAGPVRHNIVNGLKWGPDGWLYGRHGIQATSNVGKPGAPESERTRLNCCIWRYHPTRHDFEIVCQGGTNPWGHDWDQYGNLWFINTVIGHLWHGIPGAWFKRMYGEHLAPHRYELIDQHADHYHWDTGKSWTDSRNGAHGADALGGGHAHSGLMVYLGDNWPERYRHGLFTLNFHGRRINHERLERQGSGYVGRHEPDLVQFADPWFRGIDLAYGPDGGVFVLDWSDTGECHENDADGVHRETGRIFKITYGDQPARTMRDVAQLSDADLVQLQRHANEWFARHARRVLQERAAAGNDLGPVHAALRMMLAEETDLPLRLRALWTLHVTAGTTEAGLRELLGDGDENVRAWAVTLLTERRPPDPATLERFVELGAKDQSARVRLALASALQRLELEARFELAHALMAHAEDADDHNLPLMIWYGIEPCVSRLPVRANRFYTASRIPLVRQLVVRRLAERLDTMPDLTESVLRWAADRGDPQVHLDVARGLSDALRGWRKAAMPSAWDRFQQKAAAHHHSDLDARLRELGLVFGDGRALAELRRVALDTQTDGEARRAAVRQLMEARAPELESLLHKLINDPVTVSLAARGLAASGDEEAPSRILRQFHRLDPQAQAAVIGALVTRASSARALLEAVAEGRVPRHLINSLHARQMLAHNDPALSRQLADAWGEVRATDADKQEVMARYKALLTPERLRQADLPRGRELFNQLCAVCHRLYGEGKTIGPDLTGSGRSNLDYLLENIVDPSAVLPADFRVSNIEMKDDRSLSGVIVARTERTVELQTQNERLALDRSEISAIRESSLSLMPEGLLEPFPEEQVRDLIGYLMSPQQVPLPARTEGED